MLSSHSRNIQQKMPDSDNKLFTYKKHLLSTHQQCLQDLTLKSMHFPFGLCKCSVACIASNNNKQISENPEHVYMISPEKA